MSALHQVPQESLDRMAERARRIGHIAEVLLAMALLSIVLGHLA